MLIQNWQRNGVLFGEDAGLSLSFLKGVTITSQCAIKNEPSGFKRKTLMVSRTGGIIIGLKSLNRQEKMSLSRKEEE